jgi:hypothetical protein
MIISLLLTVILSWIETPTMIIIAHDRGGNETSQTLTFTSGYAEVKVVIKPEALNINPGVLTCYVKFPDFFGVPITLDATLVIDGYISYTYDALGNKTKDVYYTGAGADGIWFTEDDVVNSYTSYTYDAIPRQ